MKDLGSHRATRGPTKPRREVERVRTAGRGHGGQTWGALRPKASALRRLGRVAIPHRPPAVLPAERRGKRRKSGRGPTRRALVTIPPRLDSGVEGSGFCGHANPLRRRDGVGTGSPRQPGQRVPSGFCPTANRESNLISSPVIQLPCAKSIKSEKRKSEGFCESPSDSLQLQDSL